MLQLPICKLQHLYSTIADEQLIGKCRIQDSRSPLAQVSGFRIERSPIISLQDAAVFLALPLAVSWQAIWHRLPMENILIQLSAEPVRSRTPQTSSAARQVCHTHSMQAHVTLAGQKLSKDS